MHSFQLTGISHEPFEHLFQFSDEQLKEVGAVRCTATESPGFPCRISLEDAEIDEELILIPYLHQPAASPYRASGPVFIRRNAKRQTLAAGEVPPYITSRLIAIRAYDAAHIMVAAQVCEGTKVASELERYFVDSEVAYIHLHNAKRGCFSCLVNRA